MDQRELGDVPPLAAEWFLALSTGKEGPIGLDRIHELAQAGQISGVTLVWKSGMDSWLPISCIPALNELVLTPRLGFDQDKAQEKLNQALALGRQSSQDAFKACLMFFINPMSGLSEAYQALGRNAAFYAGIAMIVVYDLSVLIGLRLLLADQPGGRSLPYLTLFLALLLPVAALGATAEIVRLVTKTSEGWQAAFFISGSFWLMLIGLPMPIAGILGINNGEVIMVLLLFSFFFAIYILLAGLTRIYRIKENVAAYALPVMLLVTAWLSKVLLAAFASGSIENSALRGLTTSLLN